MVVLASTPAHLQPGVLVYPWILSALPTSVEGTSRAFFGGSRLMAERSLSDVRPVCTQQSQACAFLSLTM